MSLRLEGEAQGPGTKKNITKHEGTRVPWETFFTQKSPGTRGTFKSRVLWVLMGTYGYSQYRQLGTYGCLWVLIVLLSCTLRVPKGTPDCSTRIP